MYYFGARYYDATLGVWHGVDAWAEKYPGFSPYVYTMNNPIMLIDPTGNGATSTHIDQDGNVIKTYNDGDNGVYVHKNGTTLRDLNRNWVQKGTTAGGQRIGEIGGLINVDEVFDNTLKKNSEKSREIFNPLEFYDLVKSRGDWDLKVNKETIYGLGNEGKTKFEYKNELYESQDLGNIHYGVVGKVNPIPAFNEGTLLMQAGAAQIRSKTSKPEWQIYKIEEITLERGIKSFNKVMMPPYGDDPRDQEMIKKGFQLARKFVTTQVKNNKITTY